MGSERAKARGECLPLHYLFSPQFLVAHSLELKSRCPKIGAGNRIPSSNWSRVEKPVRVELVYLLKKPLTREHSGQSFRVT
jgi:hypothetical protein